MKITNLIAFPLGLLADAVTLGEARVTRRIFQGEQDEKILEMFKALTEEEKTSILEKIKK